MGCLESNANIWFISFINDVADESFDLEERRPSDSVETAAPV